VQFYHKLKVSFDHVLLYEDIQLQAKALQCIPRDYLSQTADRKYKQVKVKGCFALISFKNYFACKIIYCFVITNYFIFLKLFVHTVVAHMT